MQAISAYEHSKREKGGETDPVLEALAHRLHLTTHMILRQEVSHDSNNRILARELRNCGVKVSGTAGTKKKQFLASLLEQAAADERMSKTAMASADEDEDKKESKSKKDKSSKGDDKKDKKGKKGDEKQQKSDTDNASKKKKGKAKAKKGKEPMDKEAAAKTALMAEATWDLLG